jgi:hypothetical protein
MSPAAPRSRIDAPNRARMRAPLTGSGSPLWRDTCYPATFGAPGRLPAGCGGGVCHLGHCRGDREPSESGGHRRRLRSSDCSPCGRSQPCRPIRSPKLAVKPVEAVESSAGRESVGFRRVIVLLGSSVHATDTLPIARQLVAPRLGRLWVVHVHASHQRPAGRLLTGLDLKQSFLE